MKQQMINDIKTSKFQLFTAIDYLLIDVMNNMGFDKLSYQDRLLKAKEFFAEQDLDKWSNEKIKQFLLANNADEPVLAFAGIKALQDFLWNRPSGYMVSFDAVASGTQIMSALTCSIKGMYYTGILGNTRNDIYMEAGKEYMRISGNSLGNLKENRQKLKDSLMTFYYGSLDKPRRILGKHNVKYFHETAKSVSEGAYWLRNTLIDGWDATKSVQGWLLPDLFTAYCPVEELVTYKSILNGTPLKYKIKEQRPIERSVSNAANVVHSVDAYVMREMVRRAMYDKTNIAYVIYLLTQAKHVNQDPTFALTGKDKLDKFIKIYERTKVLTITILDKLQSISDVLALSQEHRDELLSLLQLLIQQPHYEIVVVHDCFKCLPNYMNYTRYQYNHIMANLVKSNLLNFLLEQTTVDQVKHNVPQAFKDELAKYVLESNYG